MASALTRFDLLDSNDDGKITAEERDAAAARFHHGPHGDHRGGHRGPPGEQPKS